MCLYKRKNKCHTREVYFSGAQQMEAQPTTLVHNKDEYTKQRGNKFC